MCMTLSTMPLIEEVIARLGGQAQFLFKLDLAKGFHKVPMVDDSKEEKILLLFNVNFENTDTEECFLA